MTTTRTSDDSLRRNVEAIFPLLPIQQALYLRHALGGDSDPGFLQVRCILEGRLDISRLGDAWEIVANRHTSLRMSCRPRAEGDPLIVAWKTAPLPIVELDWRADSLDVEAELGAFLIADRHAGLDLATPPAQRLALIRTSDDRHHVVWTCHHLFLDGWSSAQVLNEVIDVYGSLERGDSSNLQSHKDVYRSYYNWAANRDQDDSRAYWSERLGGFDPPNRLATAGAGGPASLTHTLGRDTANAINDAAASLKITPNSLLQGAWALMIGRLFDVDDVAFGITVAGRTAPIDGIDKLVANVSNLIPVRCGLPGDCSTGDWLVGLRDQQFESQPYEDAFLSDIQRWSGVPGSRPLFETLLVVESFPLRSRHEPTSIEMKDFSSDLTTTFPLTLAVLLGEHWKLHLNYDTACLDGGAAEQLLTEYAATLASLAQDPVSDSPAERSAAIALAPLTLISSASSTSSSGSGVRHGRDTVEKYVYQAFQITLGSDDFAVTDGFFELGGTSILAVRLFAHLERVLGQRLPLATLLEASTVEALAAVLREGGSSEWECLTPIQPKGNRPPLICVHAGDLHVLFYRHLAGRLGDDQPVYGLEPVGLRRDRAPLETVEEMAAAYVAELREHLPEGPYRLLGDCLGGAVALEVACQLEALGQHVDVLAVCDAALPRPRTRWHLATRTWETLREAGPLEVVRRARSKVEPRLARLSNAAPMTEGQMATQRVKAACNRAFVSYTPRRCQAPITLIRSSDALRRWGRGMERRWSLLTPELDVRVIDVAHSAMFHQNEVELVADVLRPLLGED